MSLLVTNGLIPIPAAPGAKNGDDRGDFPDQAKVIGQILLCIIFARLLFTVPR